MVFNFTTASDDELVLLCERAGQNPDNILSGPLVTNKVVKITDDIVVKIGEGVSEAEAGAQRQAHESVDPGIVRVPRVYRYFQRADIDDATLLIGYLFMEFVTGTSLEDYDINENPEIASRVASIIEHFHQIRSDVPGPVGGGIAQGYLWTDDGAKVPFGSVAKLNSWYNRRLATRNESIDFSETPFVLCHLDLVPRNIIVLEDGTYCVIDWASSGFYPRYFELAAFYLYNTPDWEFVERLIAESESLLKFSPDEKSLMKSVGKAYNISMRIAFPEPEDEK